MSEEGGRRAKRRCARNKYTSTAMPSAIHYVGYVSRRSGGWQACRRLLPAARRCRRCQPRRRLALPALGCLLWAAPAGGGR